MHQRISNISNFLLQLDALKLVQRKTYICGGDRLENSAEHSWHLAIACWAFAEILPNSYDVGKLIQLAILHDLGEIEAGDTFLYSSGRNDAHIEERQCVKRLAEHKGNSICNLLALWEEQETGSSKEAKLLKVVDRLLPFLHNMHSEGRSWKEHSVHKNQVLAMHQFIEHENPEIYAWFLQQLDHAVAQGWLQTVE